MTFARVVVFWSRNHASSPEPTRITVQPRPPGIATRDNLGNRHAIMNLLKLASQCASKGLPLAASRQMDIRPGGEATVPPRGCGRGATNLPFRMLGTFEGAAGKEGSVSGLIDSGERQWMYRSLCERRMGGSWMVSSDRIQHAVLLHIHVSHRSIDIVRDRPSKSNCLRLQTKVGLSRGVDRYLAFR